MVGPRLVSAIDAKLWLTAFEFCFHFNLRRYNEFVQLIKQDQDEAANEAAVRQVGQCRLNRCNPC